MSELQRGSPSYELPIAQLDLYLGWIGLKNHYAQHAVDYYRHCRDGLNLAPDAIEPQEDDEKPEELNLAMLDLAVAADEPELAMHFLVQIEDLDSITDFYFRTQPHPRSNAAEKVLHDALADLPHRLEMQPRALCKFLVRGIGEMGPVGQIDVSSSADAVLKITDDKQIFPNNHSSTSGELTTNTPEGVRYNLALALLKCGEYDLADQVVDDLPNFAIRSRKSGIGFYLNDMYKYEKWLAKTLRGELSGKERGEITSAAQSGLSHWHAANSYSALCLAINSAGKTFYHDYYVSKGRGLGANLVQVTDKTTWSKYAEKHPGRFLWDDLPKDFHELYSAMFPDAAAKYWANKNRGDFLDERYRDTQEEAIERIRAIARSGNHDLADHEFHLMIEGRNNKHYHVPTIFKASVVMAKHFAESPPEQLDLEAHIAAATEMVGYELDRISLQPIGAIEESQYRQQLDNAIEEILMKIEDINQESRKEAYFRQLLSTVSDAQVVNPKIKQAVTARLGAQRYVRQNLFKTWRPSEVPSYFVDSVESSPAALES